MHSTLVKFLNCGCRQDRGLRYKLIDFVRTLHESLPPETAKLWPRSRIVDELREVFEIGTDEYDVAHVAGVGPRAEWRAKEGRLFLVREKIPTSPGLDYAR